MARSSRSSHPNLQDIPPYQLKKSKTYKVSKRVHGTTKFGKRSKLNLPGGGMKKGLSAKEAAIEIEKIRKEAGSKWPKQVYAAVMEE